VGQFTALKLNVLDPVAVEIQIAEPHPQREQRLGAGAGGVALV
jgi:hypothetical protein